MQLSGTPFTQDMQSCRSFQGSEGEVPCCRHAAFRQRPTHGPTAFRQCQQFRPFRQPGAQGSGSECSV